MKPLGVAVVGAGYWGPNLVRNFRALPAFDLAWVCDLSRERALQAIGPRSTVRATDSLDDVLADPEIDAVAVATPAGTHTEVVLACLDAGKHVLVEKPLTTDADTADLLVKAAEAAGLTLLVGHTFLFNGAVLRLKEVIDGGELGEIYCIYARRTNLGPIRDDVNALWDLAPHDIAVFHYLVGAQPFLVSAVGHRVLNRPLEDLGFVSLHYPRNILCHLHVSWIDPHKVRETVVVGSEGRAAFNDLDQLEPLRIFYKGVHAARSLPGLDDPASQRVIRDGDIRSPRVVTDEPLRQELVHFVECVRHRLRPRSDGRFGTSVVRVLEAIDSSLAAQGAPTPVGGPAVDEVVA